MLDQIKKALESNFDIPVYYGTSAEASGQRIYDYIVFWRDRISWKTTSRGDTVEHYKVSLVRQNFIPEDETTKVIDALRPIQGLKESGDIEMDYLYQPGTALALEVATYSFVVANKNVSGSRV